MTNSEQPGNTPQPEPTVPPQPDPSRQYYPQQPYPQQTPQPAGPYPGDPYATAQPTGAPYPGQQYPQQPYTGQPYQPQQPYPGEPPQPVAPWAAQPVGSYAGQYYGESAGPGYPPQAPPPERRSGKVPLILAGAVTGLIVLAVVATFALGGGRGADPGAAPTPGPGVTVAPSAPKAEDAVRGYLEALSRGDAAAALAFAAQAPGDPSLLTEAVLAGSLAQAPLSNINVSPGTGAADRDEIAATYQLGDRAVSTTFTAVRTGSDWRLDRVTQVVSLASLDPEVSPLRINGVPLAGAELELFPGAYSVTSDSSRYTVAKGTFTLDSPTAFTPRTGAMSLALSKAGVAEIRTAAQKKLRSCLKVKKLAPSGCGFATRLPSGKPRTSTISWKVTKGGNAMKTMKPTLTPGDPTSAGAYVNVTVVCTFASTNGYSWRGVSGIYSVQALLSSGGVKVTFN